VTEAGGAYGYGIVFELSPTGTGRWNETVLYNFKGGTQDGASPHATLFRDSAGDLYGTTVSGGLNHQSCNGGCGIAFELTPSGGGWQETVLYRFSGGADGRVPYAGVTVDSGGSVYGATIAGGASDAGGVYKLTPDASGSTQTVLYSFKGRPDGVNPYATPILDSAGNLYGTANAGGTSNNGMVYELMPQGEGEWAERVLHNFGGGTDGAEPLTNGVIFDANGNLYGTTQEGGSGLYGIAYQLAPTASGLWTETILHSFLGVPARDAGYPNGVIFDDRGNLWGTSSGGGIDNPGTIFKIVPTGGSWKETVMFSFTGQSTGVYPSATLVMDPSGQFYGTTLWGGPTGTTTGGVAFQFTP
jgi:uncharacterized repeat protein (TIGR03803 family)